MANTFREVYKKTGTDSYQLVGNVGVNGVKLDIMKGATSNEAGEIGLVPKPSLGQEDSILIGSGKFDNIEDVLSRVGYNKVVSRNGTGCSVRFDDHWVAIFINARVSLNESTGYVNSIILPEYTVSSSDAVTITYPLLRSDWRPLSNNHIRISFSNNIRNAIITLQEDKTNISNVQIIVYQIFPRPWFNIDISSIPGTIV